MTNYEILSVKMSPMTLRFVLHLLKRSDAERMEQQ